MNNIKKVCRLALLCLSVSTLVACSSLSEKTSSSSSENQTEASSSSSEKKGLFAKAKEKLSSSDFNPQDVSDTTIESIKIYEDYLIMNEKIIDNYYTEADEAFKGTVLEDSAAIQELKDSTKKEMEDLKKQYGPLKKAPIQGKEEVIKTLKDYRDNLHEQVEQWKASL
ncbi:hypothetical protein AZK19_00785 [Streptococcus pneumoniae]|uniref:Lipoprotein n=1 Tax=Streptococcus pneumoniae TaxID=1313 RepID=A0A559A9P6_STREE|nr:hypothetical protein [Streptococcus pneumoniae]KXV89902.1 hypothetical protein NTPn4_04585 [Streptococcus pneumoniae]KXW04376.1 hypothetical protein NTPn15_06570 [Streptococcus pneumoniae]KXW22180.1 hypothetical protein NTPn29_09845 [Streptococcus pneumoniae]KXW27906.1 hypothetical protein NTPn31_08780 [Streptococcus pneumoniae]KXW40505.1 hypothetical protein NTPn42_02300 [Streptococcus pneumoniae]